MPGLVLRLLISALGLWIAQAIVPSIQFSGPGTLLAAALLLGFVNAVVRPIVVVLTLPITIVTLGVFLLVVNAAMLGLVAWLLPGFSIGGFGASVAGAIIVSATGWLASWYIGPRGQIEVLVVRREGMDPR